MDAELRQILEAVAASGPATRDELRDVIASQGARSRRRSGKVSSDRFRNQAKLSERPIVLSLFALRYVDEAASLLDDFVRVLRLAVERYSHWRS